MDLLRWTLLFLILALVFAVFGFGGIAADFATIGKALFLVFVILALITFLFGRGRGRGRRL
ncbi:hypothetical protein AA103196_0763 [Ameyamaea chiangmaiensis NBRC 103196]|uniref:UPF0391 membrane protein HUK82_10270 n=1 Tax=Ameyamaea chiangmaiensis TaxID=442969 RepID=A0A850P8K4_9PROT|nr:DUF1328 domain-containing protein [Ameyamaea chiangmaiensis]MBS4075866.1 DUF1328 domain-containing protein [Ameyamaea chiangmaiensis]NVN40945.1 DUF1328 domain-containing protein [Ameyamaea chiangmaiensis]GBQ64028.1 hypothetical protein AA103196_0763 [Ameyamaea chiangmaiensis NBRC 103196]